MTPLNGNDSLVAVRLDRACRKGFPACAIILVTTAYVFADDLILPDGKGREQVENACTVCHSPDRIMRQTLTPDQWRSEVRIMVENGASLNPDEWDPVVAYLSKYFGPKIDVNKSTAQEIAAALQLPIAEAAAIVAYRTANGALKDLNDLQKVAGLDFKKLAGEEKRIAF